MINVDDAIASPCIRNCCLNEADICLGCFRSLDEVIAWSVTDNPTRQQILANCENRRKNYKQEHSRIIR